MTKEQKQRFLSFAVLTFTTGRWLWTGKFQGRKSSLLINENKTVVKYTSTTFNFVGDAEFVSVTYRLFKLPKEVASEACDMIYEGGIRGAEDTFKFDYKYTFNVGNKI